MRADQRGEQAQVGGTRVARRLLRRISAAYDLAGHRGPMVRPLATADERDAP